MTNQENKCPICLKQFHDPRRIPCKHVYCFKCIPNLCRPDLATKGQIVLECRICEMQHVFKNWSTLKYYVTLNCVPYINALKLNSTSTVSTQSFCSACFNVIVNTDKKNDCLEFCIHCNKNICHDCLIDHRMALKRNILHNINQYHILMRNNQHIAQQTKTKLENMKIHIDFCTFELIDQVDTYCQSIFTQLEEQKFHEETNSSSGYESIVEQECSATDYDTNNLSTTRNNVILTEPSITPIHLLGELIPSDSNLSISSSLKSSHLRLLWSLTCFLQPFHIVFECKSMKLFTCTKYGHVSVYKYTSLNIFLINTFSVKYDEQSQPMTIKSITASIFSLVITFNSSAESILHFYSHEGHLLHSISLLNEYISQIRFDHNNNYLWCLELISSTIFYYMFESNTFIDRNRTRKIQFISFKQQQSFNPFRFALNDLLIAVIDRASTGIILLFDKQTACYIKQIRCPLIDFQSCDIELTNQILIYRFPHILLLMELDNEQCKEQINAKKNLSITTCKSETEILVSMSTGNNNIFIIQCYAR